MVAPITRGDLHDALENLKGENIEELIILCQAMRQDLIAQDKKISTLEAEVNFLRTKVFKHEELIQNHTMALDNKGVI